MFPKHKRKRGDKEENSWKWFSRYIRLRDASNGMCACITCGKVLPPALMDCGHFVKRDRWNVKYHEKNNHAQCHFCNRTQDGEAGWYSIVLDKIYGSGTAKMLLSMGKREGKLKQFECELMATDYRERANAELKRSGAAKWW
jgi:hypothetical protein